MVCASSGYSRLAVCLLACGPFPAPRFCSGAVACASRVGGFCCAGAAADDGELVAVGAAVSVSLRPGGARADVLCLSGWWLGTPPERGKLTEPAIRGGRPLCGWPLQKYE